MHWDLSVNYIFLKEKIMFKNQLDKIKGKMKKVPMDHQFFAPDYIVTVLAAKMCTNSNDHSMYIKFV
jgi:hypothetical protein